MHAAIAGWFATAVLLVVVASGVWLLYRQWRKPNRWRRLLLVGAATCAVVAHAGGAIYLAAVYVLMVTRAPPLLLKTIYVPASQWLVIGCWACLIAYFAIEYIETRVLHRSGTVRRRLLSGLAILATSMGLHWVDLWLSDVGYAYYWDYSPFSGVPARASRAGSTVRFVRLPARLDAAGGLAMGHELDGYYVRSWACGVGKDGGAWCWHVERTTPVATHLQQTVRLTERQTKLTSGSALWGLVKPGRLLRLTGSQPQVVPVEVRTSKVTDVSAWGGLTCAAYGAGLGYCWPGTLDQMEGYDLGLTGVAQVRAGFFDGGCARDSRGRVWCWKLKAGQLIRPQLVANVAAISLATSYQRACAVSESGRLQCWGEDLVATEHFADWRFSMVALSFDGASCGVLRDGRVACWGGKNAWGEVGDGTTMARETPAIVKGVHNVEWIAVSGRSFCALDKAGRVGCWGRLKKF